MAKKRVWEADQFVYQTPVLDKDLTSPPSAPTKGDRYLIIEASSGSDWAGYEDYITEYNGSSWDFITPQEGMVVYVKDEDIYYRYIDSWTAWKIGLFEIDINGDLMPITDYLPDNNFELDGNNDIMPKE